MAKKKKPERMLIAAVIVISFLALLNLLVFTSKSSSVYCYLDVCIMGGDDPLNDIKMLIADSSKVILVVEGDKDATQKSGYVSGALVTFAKDFGSKNPQIIGIKFEDGVPVECICTEMVDGNFTNCENSTSYCESVTPGPGEMMLKVYYPDFAKNEIILENRTVKFQAKSGQDAFAMATFFGNLFVYDVIK